MEMVYNHQNSGIDEQVEVIFRCKDGMTTYGRIIGESAIGEFAKSRWPLYFAVKQVDEVMSTAQPCDLAYEFGDRLLDIHEYPSGFPRAGEEILTTSNPTWYEGHLISPPYLCAHNIQPSLLKKAIVTNTR
ncbi:uncharacterized protein LOC130787492 isoform X4 [Actinidia eriantha]|uniref:uncharacterized protein LOC130787492 isoform X4 n=1 Tax=Actinidia eriantha TaxID=165200 RepID=UPI00258E0DBB|nr:uncharacterized protein LOC130787492 isoform X4 [Actinidia eriantha]